MRVRVNRDICVGSGNCVYFEPTVFDQDDRDGLVTLLTDRPDVDAHESTLAAVHNCPVGALSVTD